MIQKSGNSDSYHRAFFYCIGISDTGRRNVKRVFDFEKDRIIPDGIHERWQTWSKKLSIIITEKVIYIDKIYLII